MDGFIYCYNDDELIHRQRFCNLLDYEVTTEMRKVASRLRSYKFEERPWTKLEAVLDDGRNFGTIYNAPEYETSFAGGAPLSEASERLVSAWSGMVSVYREAVMQEIPYNQMSEEDRNDFLIGAWKEFCVYSRDHKEAEPEMFVPFFTRYFGDVRDGLKSTRISTENTPFAEGRNWFADNIAEFRARSGLR